MLVILTQEAYTAEMQRILQDPTTYKKLSGDPTIKLKSALSQLINKGSKIDILNKKEAKYLLTNVPKIPVIHQVPKIHKNRNTPPGRPIVSGIGAFYSRLGEYIDTFLQPVSTQGKAYLQDSRQDVEVGEHTLLATVDVESLYTNIKQQHALDATLWALNKYSKLITTQINYLVETLKMAMMNNYFWYSGEFFNQIKKVW